MYIILYIYIIYTGNPGTTERGFDITQFILR